MGSKEGFEILKKRGYSNFVKLDSGGQGNVYKTWKNKILFAAKVVHIEDEDNEEELKRELAIIKNVKHPNIIRVEDLFRTKHKMYIVMKFMPNKCISDEIDKSGPYCESKAKLCFSEIANGIKYLHRHSVAHRDLKLDNILLDENFNPKICDFGFSKFVSKEDKSGKLRKCDTFVGTPSYEPPEVINSLPYDAFKCDVWCLGVCLFVMLNQDYPFDSEEPKDKFVEKQIKRKYKFRSSVDSKLSQSSKDLVNKLLEPNPKDRINISQVCRHRWIPLIFHELNL